MEQGLLSENFFGLLSLQPPLPSSSFTAFKRRTPFNQGKNSNIQHRTVVIEIASSTVNEIRQSSEYLQNLSQDD
jgi:hypothetical protein